jgi:serine/threonine-protein kinase
VRYPAIVIGIGTLIGDSYRIEAEIGRGGMSVVYRAAHVRLPTTVAIKVLHAHLDDETAFARFRREAEVLAAFKHPHIVSAQDFNQIEGQPYLVMEHLDGENLAQRLTREPRLPPELVLALTKQMAGALAAAHERGIVHRDLKPQNVFLCKAGELPFVKLLDFGISKLLGATDALTQSAVSLGTPSYMSPEQARGASGSVDARADQFSLAVMVYEMLAGHTPFPRGDTPLVTMARILTYDAPPIAGLAPPIMPVLWQALAKAADERWPTVATFADALAKAMAGEAAGGRVGPNPELTPTLEAGSSARGSGRRLAIAAVIVGLLAIAGAVTAWRFRAARSPASVAPAPIGATLPAVAPQSVPIVPPAPPAPAPPEKPSPSTPTPVAKPARTTRVKPPRAHDGKGEAPLFHLEDPFRK